MQYLPFLIPHHDPPSLRYSGCLLQDLWGPTGSFCLACQFATVIYCNRFQTRYIKYIEQWLPTLATKSEDDTANPHIQRPWPSTQTHASYQDLQRLRRKSLQNSFSEIRYRSSPSENMYVIENITMLQRDLRNSATSKHSIQSFQSDSISTLEYTNDENYSNKETIRRSRKCSLATLHRFKYYPAPQQLHHLSPTCSF